MITAEPLAEAHPELRAAQRNIARAADLALAVQTEALRLHVYIGRGEIARSDAVDTLMRSGCDLRRNDLEHIIREGLSGRSAGVGHKRDGASNKLPEPPRPLMRDLPPADPFPVDALSVLAPAARAIHDRVQAPLAMCGQSVLAAATLAVQGQTDIELPTGRSRPLTNYYLTIAATGERKTAVDAEALWPVRRRESALREKHNAERSGYENSRLAWDKARDAAAKNAKPKGDRIAIKALLDVLGPPPVAPLEPLLTCPEPTYTKVYANFFMLVSQVWGSLRPRAGSSSVVTVCRTTPSSAPRQACPQRGTVESIKRVRADGAIVLSGRRLAMHLMAQPDVASAMLNDPLLADQGILSRVLTTAPDAASGTRIWREPSPESDAAMKRYGARLLDILELPLPLEVGTNTLSPRALPLSGAARRLWIAFYNHVEERVASGGELEPVRGLANKLPEHAARIAAVLAMVRDNHANEVSAEEIESGIELAQHFAAEGLRLYGASRVNADLQLALRLLNWLASRDKPVVSLPCIYQHGPGAIRDKARAAKVTAILEDHGYLVRIEGGAEIENKWRRDAWRIVRD